VPQGPFPRPAGPLPRLTRPDITPQAPPAPQSSTAPTVLRQAAAATTPMSHRGCPDHTNVTSLLLRSRGVARSPATARLTSSLSPQRSACSREKRWRSWCVPLYRGRCATRPERPRRTGRVCRKPHLPGPVRHTPRTTAPHGARVPQAPSTGAGAPHAPNDRAARGACAASPIYWGRCATRPERPRRTGRVCHKPHLPGPVRHTPRTPAPHGARVPQARTTAAVDRGACTAGRVTSPQGRPGFDHAGRAGCRAATKV
jgi:hypothetical protein